MGTLCGRDSPIAYWLLDDSTTIKKVVVTIFAKICNEEYVTHGACVGLLGLVENLLGRVLSCYE
jgi:hypothetical protein